MKPFIITTLCFLHVSIVHSQEWTLDTTFQLDFPNPTGDIESMIQQADGKFVISGNIVPHYDDPTINIMRLNADASTDSTFAFEYNFDNSSSWPIKLAMQSDGKILAASSILRRYNTDGTIDSTFAYNSTGQINSISVQNDDKIIICGGLPGNNIKRLNPDGNYDVSFSYGPGEVNESTFFAHKILEDGKILVGSQTGGLKKLNSDGSLDPNFPHTSGIPKVIAVQPNGKIIFSHFNSIRRVDFNGGLDTAFAITTYEGGSYPESEIIVLPDGKIVIGGSSYIDGVLFCGIIVLDSNGYSIPTDVHPNLCYEMIPNVVSSMVLQPDGKIVIAGNSQNSLMSRLIYSTIPVPSVPIEVNVFSEPSDISLCDGQIQIIASGAYPLTLEIIDEIDPILSNTGILEIDSLCPGVYSLLVTDVNGDSLNTVFIVPSDTTFILVNPFSTNDTIQDSLTILFENCNFNYSQIDSIFIESYSPLSGDTLLVVWAIASDNSIEYISSEIVLTPGNNFVQLQFYCPTKSTIDKYFVANVGIKYDGNGISIVNINNVEMDIVYIYPNPTSGELQIHQNSPNAELIIYNLEGKILHKEEINEYHTTSLVDFANGIYILDIKNSTGLFRKKIIKH